ncbi:MAG: hypothetical protein ACTS8R_00075 [Arsenophonus sp. NC-QC1-MAG3]
MRIILAQYLELAVFLQFVSNLDDAAHKHISFCKKK